MKTKISFVIIVLLVTASLASAVPVIQFGNSSGPFANTQGNTQVTIAAGGAYDLYVYVSNDIPVTLDQDGWNDPSSGVDYAQIFAQFNSSLVNLTGGSLSRFTAIAANPFGTTAITGKSFGTYNGSNYVEGALICGDVADAFNATKVFKLALTVANPGASTTIALSSPTSIHQTLVGNSLAIAMGGSAYAGTGSVTFIPEPATLLLLGLSGIMLRKFKRKLI